MVGKISKLLEVVTTVHTFFRLSGLGFIINKTTMYKKVATKN